jgi:hypothetical protein
LGRRDVTSLSSPLYAPARPALHSHVVATALVPPPHAGQGRASPSQQSCPSVSRLSRLSPSTGPPQHHREAAQPPGRAYTEHDRPDTGARWPSGCRPHHRQGRPGDVSTPSKPQNEIVVSPLSIPTTSRSIPAMSSPDFGFFHRPVRPGTTLRLPCSFQGDLCKIPGTRL